MADLYCLLDYSIILVADPPARGILAVPHEVTLPSVIAGLARALAIVWNRHLALAQGRALFLSMALGASGSSFCDWRMALRAGRGTLQLGTTWRIT